MEKDAALGKFIGATVGTGLKAAGRFAADSLAHPIAKGLPRVGAALGLAGVVNKGRALYHGFNENAQRAMLGLGAPKTTLASVNDMNLPELMKTASAADPESMKKIAACIDLLEHYEPEAVSELTADFRAYAEHVNGKMKTAASATDSWAQKAWGGTKEIGVGAAKTLAGSLLVGMGLAASTDLLRMAKTKLTESRNFKRMMDANSNLRSKSPAELRQAFKSLQKFAPDVASDPLAAGSMVWHLTSSLEGDHYKPLREAVTLQKEMARRSFLPEPKIDFGLSDKNNRPPRHQQQAPGTASGAAPYNLPNSSTSKTHP